MNILKTFTLLGVLSIGTFSFGQCTPSTAAHYNIGDFPFISSSGVVVSQSGTYSTSAGPYSASCGNVEASSFTLYPNDALIFSFSQPVTEVTFIAGAVNNTENGTVTTNSGAPTISTPCSPNVSIVGTNFEYTGSGYENFPITVSIPGGATQLTITDMPAASSNGYYTIDLLDCIAANTCAPTTLTADNNTLPDLMDQCYINNPTAPTATNDCGSTVTGTPDVSFPVTTQGTTTVTWTFTDGTNTITQTQNIVINDVVAPVPNNNTLADYNGWCSVDSLIAPTANDNCAGPVDGTPDVTFPITTPGTTVVTWTYDDGNGNTTTQTQNVNITTVDVSVTQNGSTLIANQLVAAYQWLDCDNNNAPITGEVNQFIDVPATGSYAVEVTQNGCTDTSDCIFIDVTGLGELDGSLISLYPNPTSSDFTIDYDGSVIEIVVYDVAGKVADADIHTENKTVNMSKLAPGTYHVKIRTDLGIIVREVILIE